MAFPDLVLAVRTRDSVRYDPECACAHGEPLLDPADLTRAVLGAVLESVWGVPKTHERAASARRDFAFSAARTPLDRRELLIMSAICTKPRPSSPTR